MTQQPRPRHTPLSRSAEGMWNEPCPKNAAVQNDVAPDRAEHKVPNTDTPAATIPTQMPVAASETTYKTWTIPFAPGEYYHFEVAALDPVLAYLRTAAPKPTLRVEGFSYSRGTLATQVLADKRARRVLDALVVAGVERQSMDDQGIYANHVRSASPYTGVRVHISFDGQPRQETPATDHRSAPVHVAQKAEPPAPDPTAEQAQTTTVVAGQRPANSERELAPELPSTPTPEPWPVSPGLLRDTVSRYSQHHGWGLVWQLEEGGEVLDWVIERPFTLATDSLAEGLHTLLGPYADYLQADLCAADKTVLVSRPGAAGCTDA